MTRTILLIIAMLCFSLATVGVTVGTIALLPAGLVMWTASFLFDAK